MEQNLLHMVSWPQECGKLVIILKWQLVHYWLLTQILFITVRPSSPAEDKVLHLYMELLAYNNRYYASGDSQAQFPYSPHLSLERHIADDKHMDVQFSLITSSTVYFPLNLPLHWVLLMIYQFNLIDHLLYTWPWDTCSRNDKADLLINKYITKVIMTTCSKTQNDYTLKIKNNLNKYSLNIQNRNFYFVSSSMI